jgi:WD40 repeat protein
MPRIVSAAPAIWPEQDLLTGHTDRVDQIEFSPDGSRLATRSNDYSVILWDTTSGAIVGHPFKNTTRDTITSFSFSRDGRWLAFATESSKIRIWNAVNGKQQLDTIQSDRGAIVQVAFSPIHPYIISASKGSGGYYEIKYGNAIKLWSTSNGRRVGTEMLLNGGACCFAVSPDSTRIASVSKPGGA